MKGLCLALTCLVLAAAAAVLAQEDARTPAAGTEPERFEDRYGVVVQNNIFVRDRRPRPPESERPETREAPPPPVPEKDWVLIGVVFEEGQFRAYFENLRGQPTTRAVVGDSIATGVVDQVFLDAIAFQGEGQLVWVDIGEDLTGAPRGSGSSGSSGSESEDGDGDEAESGESADPSNMSLEERMRLRRQQEGGDR